MIPTIYRKIEIHRNCGRKILKMHSRGLEPDDVHTRLAVRSELCTACCCYFNTRRLSIVATKEQKAQ